MKQPTIIAGTRMPEYYFDERCYIAEWWNDPADADCSIARTRRARRDDAPAPAVGRHRAILPAAREQEGRSRQARGGDGRTRIGRRDPPDTAQRITNIGDEDLVFFAICTPRFHPDIYETIDNA